MRLWLALTFAAIAAFTALAMLALADRRSEHAVRDRATTLALGNTVQAAIDIGAAEPALHRRLVQRIADQRKIALFLIDGDGRLASAPASHGLTFRSVPFRVQAVDSARGGRRFVRTSPTVRGTTVGVRLGRGEPAVIVGYLRHPDLAAGLGIFRRESIAAAIWAVVLAGAVGVLVAALMARRIRRIGDAAAAIERGNFAVDLQPGIRDELGDLAATIDRMRGRLRATFGELEAERNRLRHVVGRLREAVIAVDARGRVDFANPAAVRMLHAIEGERLGEPWADVSLHSFVRELFLENAGPAEARLQADGDRTYVVTGAPPRHPGDTAVIVVVDVSESERQERAQRHFVANAAHELRTPLSGILTTVELLRSGAASDPAVADEFLANVEAEAARLARLSQALLVLARAEAHQEAPAAEPVDVERLLRRIADGIDKQTGADVTVTCEPGVRVDSDPALVEQAVTSVAANAATHTRDGRIELSAHPAGEQWVVLEVADTGAGIAEDEQERVFDRFYRGGNGARPGDGFGLGLAIARQAIEVLGGRIAIASTVGVGTTVRIELPSGRSGV